MAANAVTIVSRASFFGAQTKSVIGLGIAGAGPLIFEIARQGIRGHGIG